MKMSPRKTIDEADAELVMQTRMVWAGTQSGWMPSHGFFLWVSSEFVPHVIGKRNLNQDARAVLIVDGHSSRKCPDAPDLLAENNIDMFVLPSHSSHLLQPLDQWVFLAMNDAFRHSGRSRQGAEFILRIADA